MFSSGRLPADDDDDDEIQLVPAEAGFFFYEP